MTGSLILCGWSVGTKYLHNGEGPPQKGESLAGFSGLVAKRSLPGPRQALKFSTSKPLVGGALLSLTAPTFVLNHSVLNSCIPALFGSLVRPRGDWRGRTSGPVSACRARKCAGWVGVDAAPLYLHNRVLIHACTLRVIAPVLCDSVSYVHIHRFVVLYIRNLIPIGA